MTCGLGSAQTLSADFEKAKRVKLLEANREDIMRAFGDESPFNTERAFSRERSYILVSFSSGKCTVEQSYGVNSDDWNVGEGKAAMIYIRPKAWLGIDQIGIDYSKYRKEPLYRGRKDYQIYHDKSEGIAITLRGNIVDSIILFPSRASNSQLCNDEKIRRYYSKKEWKRDPQPKYACILNNLPSNVVDLVVDNNNERVVTVQVKAEDPENDVLTYNYKVSVGKIVGVGANVVWDLTGVTAGTYTITVGVDDGAGIVGTTITKAVIVK